jgi:autophagy-related protein 11
MLQGQKDEASAMIVRLENDEAKMLKTNEELESEKAQAASLTTQLEEERQHLQGFRAKLAEGETGSEALRQRITEEESKVTNLSAQLAKTKSHVNSLDVELLNMQSKYRTLNSTHEAMTQRLQQRTQRAKELTQRLYAQNNRLNRLLEGLGFIVTHQDGQMVIQRASKTGTSTVLSETTAAVGSRRVSSPNPSSSILDNLADLSPLLWMEKDDPSDEAAKFAEFSEKQSRFNFDVFCEAIAKRLRDMEHTARRWQKEARAYRDKAQRLGGEAHDKIAYRSFKEGDLALFLPTRNQARGAWAAFNVGAPHYFLRREERHRLKGCEWLVARITKVQERVVDLSKPIVSAGADGKSIAESEGGVSFEDDNPFELSDGLRWYLLDAQEEKPGTPSTPGLGKTTVAAANVEQSKALEQKQRDLGAAKQLLQTQTVQRRDSGTGVAETRWRHLAFTLVMNGRQTKMSKDDGKAQPEAQSPSEVEWERQKRVENASNDAIDALMKLTGLEQVKEKILDIKAKIETLARQGIDMKKERLGMVMLGNPGTGENICSRFLLIHCSIVVRQNYSCKTVRAISCFAPSHSRARIRRGDRF